MPRFLVIEQGPSEKVARMVLEATSAEEARQRMVKAGWNVASVTIEGDIEGPASAEQIRAKLTALEQRIEELGKRPALRMTFWRVFLAALLAALAMWPVLMLLGNL